jgi:hypothetical protein
MADIIGILLLSFVLQLGFLILCMHLAGRKFGIDFGPFWSAVGKAAIILVIASVFYVLVGHYCPWYARMLVVAGIYYFGFMFAFGLDASDAGLFAVVYFVAMVLVNFVVVFVILANRQ